MNLVDRTFKGSRPQAILLVFRAHDHGFARDVAVKLLPREYLDAQLPLAQAPRALNVGRPRDAGRRKAVLSVK
jgi:hypothetical protein